MSNSPQHFAAHGHGAPTQPSQSSTQPSTLIETHGLSMQFGSVRALHDVSVTVHPGITGLIGVNGAGKSTLMSLALGLRRPSGGSIRVLGLDPMTSRTQLRQQIAFVPERNVLPDDTKAVDYVRHLAEMKGIPRNAATPIASDALGLVGLGEERNRELGTMSTGQRQRAKLAQALASSPQLIMLDEATAGLDPAQRDNMLDVVASVSRDFGVSILVSSHLMEEIEQICDRVVILDAGRLLAAGRIDDLLSADAGFRVEFAGAVDAGLLNVLGSKMIEGDSTGGFSTPAHTADPTLVITSGQPTDVLLDRIRDVIAYFGVPLRSLNKNRRTLANLFEQFDQNTPGEHIPEPRPHQFAPTAPISPPVDGYPSGSPSYEYHRPADSNVDPNTDPNTNSNTDSNIGVEVDAGPIVDDATWRPQGR